MMPVHFLRMRIEKMLSLLANLRTFITPLQIESCENALAGVCRQLSNAYLNSSNANVLPSANNNKVARPAALVVKWARAHAGFRFLKNLQPGSSPERGIGEGHQNGDTSKISLQHTPFSFIA
jgi:hypothetical protein